jgi:hypothetical protein
MIQFTSFILDQEFTCITFHYPIIDIVHSELRQNARTNHQESAQRGRNRNGGHSVWHRGTFDEWQKSILSRRISIDDQARTFSANLAK